MSEEEGFPASSRRLLWAVIAGVVLYAVLDVVAQALPPHYNPIQDAESDLAVGPYGFVMAVNFVNRGLLSLVFVYSLTLVHPAAEGARGNASSNGNRHSRGLYLLGVWGLGAILLAIFPTDVPATPVSWHGAIHLLVATIAFLAGAFGALNLSLQFGQSQALRGVERVATAIAALAVIFCLVTLGLPFVVPHLSTRIGGLDERVFLAMVFLWMTTVSIHLLRYRPRIGADGSNVSKDKYPEPS
jgi:hypothetical membrane protein